MVKTHGQRVAGRRGAALRRRRGAERKAKAEAVDDRARSGDLLRAIAYNEQCESGSNHSPVTDLAVACSQSSIVHFHTLL